MSDVKRWCENPVNGGPWVVLASDYDTLRAELAATRTLLKETVDDRQQRVAELAALREAAGKAEVVVRRYLAETPLGHQPHMIASEAGGVLADLAALRAKIKRKDGADYTYAWEPLPALENLVPCRWCGTLVSEQTEQPADYCTHEDSPQFPPGALSITKD
jgi:hypothetical protein